jgi:hypothetical protein
LAYIAIGQIGLEGYFACDVIAKELQRYGYVGEDVLSGLNLLLQRKLIAADHMNFKAVRADDSVRILASGYMHLRVLVGRLEYVYGVLAVTPIFDRAVVEQLGDYVRQDVARGKVNAFSQSNCGRALL